MNSRSRKKPKEVGKHQWNFHQFLKFLDEHDAVVRIKHSSQAGETSVVNYSSQKGDLSLRQLVFDACGFDSMAQVYSYTKGQVLRDKIPKDLALFLMSILYYGIKFYYGITTLMQLFFFTICKLPEHHVA